VLHPALSDLPEDDPSMARVAHLTSVHACYDTRIFHKECKTLVAAGHDVLLVVPHGRDETIDGVKIRAVPKPKGRLDRMTRTAWHVYRAAIAENAQLYHFHDPELIPIGLLLRMQGKLVVFDVHEDYVSSLRQKRYLPYLVRLPLAGLWARAEALVTRPFETVLAEKYYATRFPSGMAVLNYPLKEHFPAPPSECQPKPSLLYTGAVSQDRGALLHSQVVTLVDDVEVYVVGRCNGDLAQRMRQVAGDSKGRLHIEGEGLHVPYDRILDYYGQRQWLAGLAIFPPTPHYMRKELTKFFEYMGAGIPILCSDFPVWRSLMENTGAGLCVDPRKPDAIAMAIRYLREHPEEAREMANNGRRAFESQYNWDSEAKKLIGLYQALIP
jgi:glycosyltransferase involved in cell wall biosynthesis